MNSHTHLTFKRQDFLPLLNVRRVKGAENFVQVMEQSAVDMAAAVPWPLHQYKEVIHKHINIMEELGVFLPR